MYEFKRLNKYLVLKQEDIESCLTETQKSHLQVLLDSVRYCRKHLHKEDNSYVVVNEDESYAGAVWKLIEEGERRKYEDAAASKLVEKTKNAPRGSFFNP